MELILWRHAEAEDDTGAGDQARELTKTSPCEKQPEQVELQRSGQTGGHLHACYGRTRLKAEHQAAEFVTPSCHVCFAAPPAGSLMKLRLIMANERSRFSTLALTLSDG